MLIILNAKNIKEKNYMQNQITKAIKQNAKEIIPIFFSTDNNYIPFLSVALRSLIENASKNYRYIVRVLSSGIDPQKSKVILDMSTENFDIQFIDVSERVRPFLIEIQNSIHYQVTIASYYRLFIASMFKEFDKALYLDCDIVVLDDISKLFNIDLGDNILGGAQCQIIRSSPVFREYSKQVLGLSPENCFNAGILIMNLDAYRKNNIENSFIDILKNYKFELIANDQDYLNFLCKGKVKMIDISWNKAALRDGYKGKPNLVHFAFIKKPWTNYGVKFEKYFWEYAKKVNLYEYFMSYRRAFKHSQRIANHKHVLELEKKAVSLINSDKNIHKILDPKIEELKSIEFCKDPIFNYKQGSFK
ncbi:MAG: glycosyltransferase family 8 protein [Clostridia bacterium]|nr:glycosyltransferase family 8 protein [Clostridia bacterium]